MRSMNPESRDSGSGPYGPSRNDGIILESRGLTAYCRRAIEQWGLRTETPPGKPSCPFASTAAAPISPSDSRPSWRQARGVGRRRGCGARHRRRRGGARRRGADRGHQRNSTGSSSTAEALRVTPAEIDAAVKACDADDARRAEIRPRPHRGLSPPATAEGRALHRRARRRARLALERDRGGRALCAGRHRRLSVLGADERGAGQGRRRARAS